MRISRVVVLLAGSFAFANTLLAQALIVSNEEAPILTGVQPPEIPSRLFAQAAQPEPPSAFALPQSSLADLQITADRYRAEVELLAQKRRQFVHCKLKNGEVLTGILRDRGDTSFAIQTNALGEVTSVEYTNLAESPRAAPAAGTRIKQGAEWTAFVVFVVVFFIPLALTGVIPNC